MTIFRLLCFCTLLLRPLAGRCQVIDSSETNLAKAKVLTFFSRELKENRKVFIYCPRTDSQYISQTSFPVLYLMDAEEQLGMVMSQVIYLSESYSILPPMIIVGLGNIDRTKDLTPTHSITGNNGKADTSMAATLRTSGNGEKFLGFIRTELIPYIQKQYKPSPFRVFCGHSLGGLMSVYALLKHPDMFSAYVAISPSLWWDDQYPLKLARQLTTDFTSKKLIFMSDGSEGGQFHKDLLQLNSILREKKFANLDIKYTYYPHESHPAEPVKATYDALRHIFQPVYPPQFDTLSSFIYFKPEIMIDYYKSLSAKTGYKISPPESVIDRLAQYLLSLNTAQSQQDALVLLKLNLSNYPMSWHAHYKLAGMYHHTLKKKDQATLLYQEAFKLNPANKMLGEMVEQLNKSKGSNGIK